MVHVIWAPLALHDLIAIRDYIGKDSPLAGQRMAQRLRQAGEGLAPLPNRGRPASGGLSGTRCLSIPTSSATRRGLISCVSSASNTARKGLAERALPY